MSISLMSDLDQFEDELMEQFRQHAVFQNMHSLTEAALLDLLLQRRFLSLSFTTMYDLAIDALEDEQATKIVRYILREEYPDVSANTPSHREDLFHDLTLLGASKPQVLASRPSKQTREVIEAGLALATGIAVDDTLDVKILTIVRFWGEVLVSVEYGQYWSMIAKTLIRNGKNVSRFYYPHHIHDAKKKPLSTFTSRAATHADRLAGRLVQLINSDAARASFIESEQAVLGVKMRFYDQFIPLLK